MAALFKTIEEVKKYISVANANFPDILPDIEWAEKKYLVPVLGQAQYDLLLASYNATISTPLAALLPYVQMPLIHLAYSKYFLIGQVLIDGNGVSIVHEGNRKTAFDWQIEGISQDYAAEKAFDGIDFLLNFLEANKDTYAAWAGSSAYTVTKQFFINKTEEFERFVNINNSRRTFTALWPVMRAVEELQLEGILGTVFYAELKTAIAAGNPSADLVALIKKIQPVAAYLTAADALLRLPLKVRDGGALVIDTITSSSSSNRERKAANERAVTAHNSHLNAVGQTYLGKLKDFLQSEASSTKYATFYNSSLYIHPEERAKAYVNKDQSNWSF